jgi:hypothetical protein
LFTSLRRWLAGQAEQPVDQPSESLNGAGRPPIETDHSAVSAPVVYLCCVGPAASGSRHLLQVLVLRSYPCVVGRHPDCEHQLACAAISRRHCAFRVQGGRVWVEDLGSRHGTRLNGQLVEGLRPLQPGDRLELAYLTFVVRMSGRSARARI